MPLILLVDDDLPIIHFLLDLLEEEGYRVQTAYHGAEALSRIAAEPPDLIISDLMMPVMDGSQLCARIRSDPQLASIPIIMISAAGERAASAAGANASFTKPFDVVNLLDCVTQLLTENSVR